MSWLIYPTFLFFLGSLQAQQQGARSVDASGKSVYYAKPEEKRDVAVPVADDDYKGQLLRKFFGPARTISEAYSREGDYFVRTRVEQYKINGQIQTELLQGLFGGLSSSSSSQVNSQARAAIRFTAAEQRNAPKNLSEVLFSNSAILKQRFNNALVQKKVAKAPQLNLALELRRLADNAAKTAKSSASSSSSSASSVSKSANSANSASNSIVSSDHASASQILNSESVQAASSVSNSVDATANSDNSASNTNILLKTLLVPTSIKGAAKPIVGKQQIILPIQRKVLVTDSSKDNSVLLNSNKVFSNSVSEASGSNQDSSSSHLDTGILVGDSQTGAVKQIATIHLNSAALDSHDSDHNTKQGAAASHLIKISGNRVAEAQHAAQANNLAEALLINQAQHNSQAASSNSAHSSNVAQSSQSNSHVLENANSQASANAQSSSSISNANSAAVSESGAQLPGGDAGTILQYIQPMVFLNGKYYPISQEQYQKLGARGAKIGTPQKVETLQPVQIGEKVNIEELLHEGKKN